MLYPGVLVLADSIFSRPQQKEVAVYHQHAATNLHKFPALKQGRGAARIRAQACMQHFYTLTGFTGEKNVVTFDSRLCETV